ncbi:IclR family transcriptional regulator [Chelatococcus reniformis]|uniref:IclR family transcriptional regulator n=1 Tax=Chelatococcus reniformis TaxID=1494448 RepID=A0A916UAX8_9HYPH|nr:IclR family transcriptional regulator [Chelatococcus reniformis]GGC65528.1 IclR family transcriptional regulator [Chelatococcus reniformis]
MKATMSRKSRRPELAGTAAGDATGLADPGLVKSVGKAMALLETLYEAGRPMRVIEIAGALNVSASAVSRLVSTLATSGFVDQDEDSRCHLGFGLALLGHATLGRRELDRIALPYIGEVSSRFKEYVSLGRLYRWKVIIMRQQSPQHALDVSLMSTLPVHATAPGKLLAAWQDPNYVREMLRAEGMHAFTAHTFTSIDAFMDELARVREVGHSWEEQELFLGLRHVAAPVRDHEGSVIATISAGGPIDFVDGDELEKLTQAILRCASEISRQLGYRAKPF